MLFNGMMSRDVGKSSNVERNALNQPLESFDIFIVFKGFPVRRDRERGTIYLVVPRRP